MASSTAVAGQVSVPVRTGAGRRALGWAALILAAALALLALGAYVVRAGPIAVDDIPNVED